MKNSKSMYVLLTQQLKTLKSEEVDGKVNEIPEDFNQNGWEKTSEKVQELLSKMEELYKIKGKRLTPQFYRSIYNRALIGIKEIDKLTDTLIVNSTDIDFEKECLKLMEEITNLTKEN